MDYIGPMLYSSSPTITYNYKVLIDIHLNINKYLFNYLKKYFIIFILFLSIVWILLKFKILFKIFLIFLIFGRLSSSFLS